MKKNVETPECKLIGENGNIFNLISLASEALRKANLDLQVQEMQQKVLGCHTYDEALSTIGQYVNIQ